MTKLIENNYKYYLLFSIFIWCLALIINKVILTYIAALFGSLITASIMKNYFDQKSNPFSLLNIGSIFLIFTVNMGWILSIIFIFIKYKIDIFNFIKNYLFITHESYLFANVYTLLFCLVLFLLSSNKKLCEKEFFLKTTLDKFIQIDISNLKTKIIIIIIFEAILFYNGFLDYRSYANQKYQAGIISWYIPYLDFIFHFHIAITSLFIFKFLNNTFSLNNLIIIIISIILFSIIFFIRGRYQFFFSYVELFFWYCFFNKNLPKLKNIIIFLIIYIPIVYNLTIFNDFIRNNRNNLLILNNEKTSFIFKLPKFYNLWKFSNKDENIDKTTVNFTQRFLLLYPLAVSIEIENSQKKFLLGENIVNNIIWTIPRVIFPNKVNFDVKEDLMSKFGVNFIDTSDSIYLFSYLDFWIFGIILYPLIFFFYWYFIINLLTFRKYNPLILIFLISKALLLFFSLGEGGSLNYFVYARDLLIITIFISFINFNNIFFNTKSP
jgi:hypothetical protein